MPLYLKDRFCKIVSPPVHQRLEKAQSFGESVALFSSSPDFIVECVAKRLNINHVLSSKYEVDKEGRFVKIPLLVNGEEKRIALLNLVKELAIPLSAVVAYSDSILDLPLLKLAKRVICVNPDQSLRELAHIKKWEIISHESKI